MIKNIFVGGRMQMLLVPEEEADEYDIFETLQAQTERIELLEKQNATLIRNEEQMFELLELSKKTESEIVERLWQLTNIVADRICGHTDSEQEPNSDLPDPGQANGQQ